MSHHVAPFLHFGIERFMRHGVDQLHRERLRRRIAAAQIPNLARLLFADHAREKRRAVARIDRAHLRPRLREHGLLRRDREVADRAQHIAAADRVALHACDHGLGHVADRVVQLFHRQADGAAAVVLAFVRGLIAAGAKGFLARAREHDHTDFPRIASPVDRMDELVAGASAKRVHLLGTVDRDPGRAVAHFVEDVFVIHVGFLVLDRFQPAIVRPLETLSTWPVM